MNVREARRLALLIVWDDTSRGLDTSDEWVSHPETGEPFTREECVKVKEAGLRVANALLAQAERLQR